MTNAISRTPTGTQTVFNLTHPDPIIFDFSTPSAGLKMTILPNSDWVTGRHWHETAPACETIEPLSGSWMIEESLTNLWGSSGTVTGGGPGFVMPLVPGLQVSWRRNPHDVDAVAKPVMVYLKGAPQMLHFYRQLCSVNQDAELYLRLPSTPLWLRGLYALLGVVPHFGTQARKWLVSRMLWIQLRVIYYKNDYWTYEGRIWYTRPWWDLPGAMPPPEKWRRHELRSVVIISRLVLSSCYWVGTTLLGMRTRYEEYEEAGSHDSCVDAKKALGDM